jgi:hypothetical protein
MMSALRFQIGTVVKRLIPVKRVLTTLLVLGVEEHKLVNLIQHKDVPNLVVKTRMIVQNAMISQVAVGVFQQTLVLIQSQETAQILQTRVVVISTLIVVTAIRMKIVVGVWTTIFALQQMRHVQLLLVRIVVTLF